MPYRHIEPASEKEISNTENVITNVDGNAPFSGWSVAYRVFLSNCSQMKVERFFKIQC